ncbi:MAG: tRNA (N(6)-L-threonylcarbamoyladenosine(37)-C(2))-methylthiotransferase MtaB, partial [Pseudomonadota bacterium]
ERMPQLPKDVVKRRAAILRSKGSEALVNHLDKWVGQHARPLTEKSTSARLADFTPVTLEGFDQPSPGRVTDARIVGHDGQRLIGHPL